MVVLIVPSCHRRWGPRRDLEGRGLGKLERAAKTVDRKRGENKAPWFPLYAPLVTRRRTQGFRVRTLCVTSASGRRGRRLPSTQTPSDMLHM